MALIESDEWATGVTWAAGHYDSGTTSYSWIFGSNAGNFETYLSDGGTVYWKTSSAHGLANGAVQWVRTDVDVDNGASGTGFSWWLGGSASTPSWTTAFSTATDTVHFPLTLDNSTAALTVGGINVCSGGNSERIYALKITDTTGTVVDVDFRNSVTDPDLTTTLGADGYTYTESARGDFVVEGLTTVLAGGDSELAAAAAISASIAAFLAGFIVITVAVRD